MNFIHNSLPISDSNSLISFYFTFNFYWVRRIFQFEQSDDMKKKKNEMFIFRNVTSDEWKRKDWESDNGKKKYKWIEGKKSE